MPCRSRTSRVRRSYEFIKAHCDEYDVTMMCRVLDVARAGYYAWLREPLSNRDKEDARLLRLIQSSYKASHGVYGARRVFLDLREAGETCSKHRVERLMRENGIRALHGYRTRYRVPRSHQPPYRISSSATSMLSGQTKSGSPILRVFALGRAGTIWLLLWIFSRERSSVGPRPPRSIANLCWTRLLRLCVAGAQRGP